MGSGGERAMGRECGECMGEYVGECEGVCVGEYVGECVRGVYVESM